jgi:hydroxypyruvate reductase
VNATPRDLLRRMFEAAIASAQPELCLPPHLPEPPRGRLVVIGAGKASAEMARVVEARWPGPLSGIVVTRYGYAAPCARIEIIEAAHPTPDDMSVEAARRILATVADLTPDDLVLCLISGGGSALMCLPGEGLTLADKQNVNKALLASGATITEMNCLRRHLSAIKGGRLAAACHPARVLALAISDVPGDHPVDIASGPTVGDTTTCADALEIARRHGIALPPAARALLESGRGESVKPGDPRLAGATTRLIATPFMALEAAAAVARQAGVTPIMLGDRVEGEAREVARAFAGVALGARDHAAFGNAPCVLLSGGETTVTVRGDGRGGRNVEFLLSLAVALDGAANIHALAGDTDGVDGAEDVAGAIIAPDTLVRARALGHKARDFLDRNDAHTFFAALGDQVVTGPTRTNVNDFRAILVSPGIST